VSRLVLVQATPRTAPGTLTWAGWAALQTAEAVRVRGLDDAWRAALTGAGVRLRDVTDVASVAEPQGTWFDTGDDEELVTSMARAAVARGVELEVVMGSYDLPGSRLLDLVQVMDRLRSPGGCPWDAEQTHSSLLRYLVEEAYETVEAVETGDREHLREELGDLLLQVVFHARIATEHPTAPFSVDEVAAGIVEKLVRRHPHVFGDAEAPTAEHVEASWEQLKAAEKGRASVLDGIPPSMPALARTDKVMTKAARLELPLPAPAEVGEDVGEHLLAVVSAARAAGVDPEAALRESLRRLEIRLREAEAEKNA